MTIQETAYKLDIVLNIFLLIKGIKYLLYEVKLVGYKLLVWGKNVLGWCI